MSGIPSDILDAAEQAASDLDDIHFNSRSASWLDDARDIVAAALMVERERCAKIAEQAATRADAFVEDHIEGGMSIDFQRWSEGCRHVAAAIRTPSTGGGGIGPF